LFSSSLLIRYKSRITFFQLTFVFLGLQTTDHSAKLLVILVNKMGCNTTKEALQPVEDNGTSASKDTQKNQTKTANNAVKAVPEIGEYICSLLNQMGFAILVTSVAMQDGEIRSFVD